jgi:hypothetical protein
MADGDLAQRALRRRRIFAMLDSERPILVMLTPRGACRWRAIHFEPVPGRPMKEWLVMTVRSRGWHLRERHEWLRTNDLTRHGCSPPSNEETPLLSGRANASASQGVVVGSRGAARRGDAAGRSSGRNPSPTGVPPCTGHGNRGLSASLGSMTRGRHSGSVPRARCPGGTRVRIRSAQAASRRANTQPGNRSSSRWSELSGSAEKGTRRSTSR